MPSNIPLWTWGAALRLRLVTFTEQTHPSYRHLSGIPTWQSILLTGIRHVDPAHRCLSGILAEPL